MKNIKILLAGPGTGKTYRVKEEVKKLLSSKPSAKILILSFTNATINDLLSELEKVGVTTNNCMTLHTLAMKLNHAKDKHILDSQYEEKFLYEFGKQVKVDFNQLCRLLKCITFNQMIGECVTFIKINPVYTKDKIGDLDLLIVDEYQDFNEEERNLITAIADYANNTMILGDDDQCIYGFKNADSEGIISLFKDDAVAKIEHANLCYRCPKDVVIAGNNLISKNKDRVPKEWKVHNKHDGLSVHQTRNQSETSLLLLKQIQTIKDSDPTASIMILSPVNFAVIPLIEEMKTNKIEYTSTWKDKTELSQMEKIWWLRAIFSVHKIPSLVFLLKAVMKRDKRKNKKIIELLTHKFQHGMDNHKFIEKILELSVLDMKLSSYIVNKPHFSEFFDSHMEFQELGKHILESDIEKSLEKINLLITERVLFDRSKVNFMTIHKSKGLQADYVFMLGLVNGILPNESKAVDSIEAQRRVFYVGLSRAREGLFVISQIEWPSTVAYKVDFDKFQFKGKQIVRGEASPFLSELG